jgi:hypothetical protein
MYEKDENEYNILVGICGEKRPLGRIGCNWKVNIKIGFKGIGCEDVDWIHMASDRDQWWAVGNTVMNLWIL